MDTERVFDDTRDISVIESVILCANSALTNIDKVERVHESRGVYRKRVGPNLQYLVCRADKLNMNC